MDLLHHISSDHLPDLETVLLWTVILALQIPILTLILWLLTAHMANDPASGLAPPTLRGKRVVLLIAHPDDEAMFFAPTLLALGRRELRNELSILCVSTGDAARQGPVRRRELLHSALQLGLRDARRVTVLDDARFPDSMAAQWDPAALAAVLAERLAPGDAAAGGGTGAAGADADAASGSPAPVDVVLTFDSAGVSGHPNHIALYHGARAFVRALARQRGADGGPGPVALYALRSTGVLRKYSGVLDYPLTVLGCMMGGQGGEAGREGERGRGRGRGDGFPARLLAVSGPEGVRRAQLAMSTAHKSQMRWFRWGWIWLSRYMIVNDLERVEG